MAGQHYCLRWNNYQSNMTSVFHHLLQNESFVDVTLACNENSLKAHKVVLSACSSYFQKLLLDNPCKHPTIILPEEVCFDDLKFIIDFVYKGEIDVSQAELQSLLRTADQLRIKGLCEAPEEDDNEMECEEGNGNRSKIDIQRRSKPINRNSNSRFSSYQQGKRKQENNSSTPLSCLAKKCLIRETKISSDHVTQLLNNTIDANEILNSNHDIDQQFGDAHGNSVAVATSTEEDEMDIRPLRDIKSNISMQMVILDDDDMSDNHNHDNNHNISQQSNSNNSNNNNNNNQIQMLHTSTDITSPSCTTLTPLHPQQPRHVMSDHNQHQQSEMNSQDQIRHQLQTHVHIHQNSLNDECISRDVEMAVSSQPPAPTATPVHCHQLDMQHGSPTQCNMTGNTNVDSRNDQYNHDAVKVEFETLRTMDQSSDSLETMENHLSERSMNDEEHNMQTMMITPELLGLMPSSSSTQSEIGSEGRKSATPISKTWTSEDMDMALDALRNHNMSLTKASVTFGIPSTTLWQRAHRLGIDTPKKEGLSKSWNEDILNVALEALRSGSISANKASKAYGIPSSTLYKIARKEGIRLAAPFNATPTTWNPEDLERALEAIKSGQTTVQRAATEYGIPSGTLYGRCKREKIELSRSNPTPWSEDAMTEALDTVRLGHMSINQAAIHYNLPYSSLYGRFKRGKYEADHSEHIEENNVDNSPGLITSQQLQSQSDSQVNQNHIQPQIMLLQYPTSTAHIQMYQSTTSSYDK